MSIPLYSQTPVVPSLYPSSSIQPIATREVPRVDGVEGAYKCPLPADTKSTIAIDMYKPLGYLITTDGINRQVQILDIAIHQEPQHPQNDSLDNKILEHLNTLSTRMEMMEAKLNELESSGKLSSQSNTNNTGKHNKSSNKSNAAGN